MERAVCAMQETSQHMVSIYSQKMGRGKSMSAREVDELLINFQKLARGLDDSCEMCQVVYAEVYEDVKNLYKGRKRQTHWQRSQTIAAVSEH